MTQGQKPRIEWAIVVAAVALAVAPPIIAVVQNGNLLLWIVVGPALAILYVGLFWLMERLSKRAVQ